MKHMLTAILYMYILITIKIVQAAPHSEDWAVIDKLKNLDFEDLVEVEVSLDDVFDIFQGLISTHNVTAASGVLQSADMAPSVTTVITAQDIEAVGARTLADVLQMVPGLNVGRFNNNMPIYTVRGIYSAENFEILMLVNGVPLKSAFNGNRSLYDYSPPIQHIARIEVVRGPGSAVYGADALSGVINIVTKNVDDINGTEAGLRLGSFDTQDAWVLHGSKIGDVDVVASVQYGSTDGSNRILSRDEQSAQDKRLTRFLPPNYQPSSLAPGQYPVGLSRLNGHLDLRYDLWRLQLDYHSTQEAENGALLGTLDSLGRSRSSYAGLSLKWHNPTLTTDWDVATQLSYQHFAGNTTAYLAPPNTAFFMGCDSSDPDPNLLLFGMLQLCNYPDGVINTWSINEQQVRFDLTSIYTGFENHILRLGAGYVLEDLYETRNEMNYERNRDGKDILAGSRLQDLTDSSYVIYPENSRQSWSLFLQDTWHILPDWQATAGLFYNEYSDFGNVTNPRAALAWRVYDNLTARLMYGRAFRAPTFLEKSNRSSSSSPPGPEIIDNYEIAFDYRPQANLYTTLGLFRYEIKDKILGRNFNPGNQGGAFNSDLSNWAGKGMEIEIRWKINHKASLLFNYAYVDNNTRSGDRGQYPHHQAYLRTDWLVRPDWYLDTQLLWVGGRTDTDENLLLPDNITLDMIMRYKKVRNSHWNIAFGIRNLLNEDINEPPIYPDLIDSLPQAGRNFFGEIRYRF